MMNEYLGRCRYGQYGCDYVIIQCNSYNIELNDKGELSDITGYSLYFATLKRELDQLHAENLELSIENQAHKNVIAGIFALKHHVDPETRARFSDNEQQLQVNIRPLWFDKRKDEAIDAEVVKPEQLNAKVSTPDDESK